MSNFDKFRPSEEYEINQSLWKGAYMHPSPQDLSFYVLHMYVGPEITIFKICPSELAVLVNF